jgi:hypothetical protein
MVTRGRPRALSLVVVSGPDAGAKLALDAAPRIIGRAKGADLLLTDVAVSRRHLRVMLDGDWVDVTLCSGAAPFSMRGEELLEHARAGAGDKITVGDTVLSVVEADAMASEEPAPSGATVTDVRALFGGAAADVRGLSAIASLIDALDEARSPADVERTLASWAKRYADAEAVSITPTEGSEEARCRVVVRPDKDGGTRIAVPADMGVPAELSVRLASPPEQVTDALRRLLVIAGRVTASSLARLRVIDAALEDNEALRRLAMGSARAFLGESPAAAEVQRLLPKLAASDASVLLLGESGTGKTFVARLIHERSPRAREPLRVINCAAIPESLLESELFGHERGAFTGAVAARAGAFEAAGRGTLLLDEIGELPLVSQAKLLRALEDRRFERIGSNRPLQLSARVLAATNRDLAAMVEAGRFRRDLYLRLSAISVPIPALRDRGGDVALLARQILADLGAAAGRRVRDFSPAAMEAILSYRWPGNVRELRNAIERAIVSGNGPVIEPGDLPDVVRAAPPAATASAQAPRPPAGRGDNRIK